MLKFKLYNTTSWKVHNRLNDLPSFSH